MNDIKKIAGLITEDPDVIQETGLSDLYEQEAELLKALWGYLEEEGIQMEAGSHLTRGVPKGMTRHPETGPQLWRRSPNGRIDIWKTPGRLAKSDHDYTASYDAGWSSKGRLYFRFNVCDPESFPKVRDFILKHTT